MHRLRSHGRARGALPIAVVLGLFAGLASAQEASSSDEQSQGRTTLRLRYAAAEACPSEADFRQGLERRTERLRFSEEGAFGELLDVRLWQDGKTFRGSVIQKERSLERDVTAASCGDVALALTVIVLVAFDPTANLGAVDSPAPLSESAPPDEAEPSTTTAVPLERSPQRSKEPPVALSPVESTAPTQARDRVQTVRFVGFSPRIQWGDHPGLGVGAEVDVVSASEGIFGGTSLGVQATTSSDASTLGETRFLQLGVSLGLCPLSKAGLSISICGGLEGGAMAAFSQDTVTLRAGATAWRPQLAPVVSLGVRVPLLRLWSLQAGVAVAAPLFRFRYHVDRVDGSRETFFEQRPLAGRASLGVLYAF
jgi:hypothetical protein